MRSRSTDTFKTGYSEPRKEAPKPKPTIEKLLFTKEEQEEIDNILTGKPSKSLIHWWEKKGLDIEERKKWYTPSQLYHRKRDICQRYKIGLCHVCQELPVCRIQRYMHNRILTKNLSAIFLIQFDPSESQKQFLYL